MPWDRLFMDPIVPYKIIIECHDEPLVLKYLTMIDPTTRWFEAIQYNDKQEYKMANLASSIFWRSVYPIFGQAEDDFSTTVTRDNTSYEIGRASCMKCCL